MLLTQEVYKTEKMELEALNGQLKKVREEKTIQVGSQVKLELDYGDGDIEIKTLKLQEVPLNQEDVVTLKSPIGKMIFGQKEDFIGECKLGKGNIVKVHILEIL